MSTSTLGAVLVDLRRTLSRQESADLTDAALLGRFLVERDEGAFEALLLRHGPMVFGVCRRILGNESDSEDAFQATFLVLCMKAASIRPRSMVGNWLYGVAQTTALKARAMSKRRSTKEREAAQRPKADVISDNWQERQQLLDQELQGLPAKYRSAILLCDLGGKSLKEAAQQLGCPPATIGTRLSRGRSLLARRLTYRGVALHDCGGLAILLAKYGCGNRLPKQLLASTIQVARQCMTGATAGAIASAKVAMLAQGVMKAMFLTKLKSIATILAIALAVGISGWSLQSAVGGMVQGGDAFVAAQPVSDDSKPETKQDPNAADLKSLQGEWQPFDVEKNGKLISEDPSGMRIIFRGDEISFGGAARKDKFRVDATKSPRELYMTISEGQFKGQTVRSIYLLEKGELKICMPLAPKSGSATEFKTKAGDGLLLFMLRRAPTDGAGAKAVGEAPVVKRTWTRPDAPPDGNYKLCYVWGLSEFTGCLIRLETRNDKQTATLLETADDMQATAVRIAPSADRASASGARKDSIAQAPIRIVANSPIGEWVFDGAFPTGSLEARGYLEIGTGRPGLQAFLVATDLTKLKYTSHEIPPGSLQKVVQLARSARNIRQNAQGLKDANLKKEYLNRAAKLDREAQETGAELYEKGFANEADAHIVFEAALELARSAAKYDISKEKLRSYLAAADKTAATFGRRWQREFDVQLLTALTGQKEFADLVVEVAASLERDLEAADPASRARVLHALAPAEGVIRHSASARESLRELLAKTEEVLDREYRTSVPPFKPDPLVARKSQSDRAVVLELFTGTQCPPCVAASVAFDALPKTYAPAELVLLQYHLHVPGPDPLTNPDSVARWDYYGKVVSEEARGVPTTLFNGKPQAGGGGAMADAAKKYKQYRELIDPLLETRAPVNLSGSAIKEGSKVNVKIAVNNLDKPGDNVRLRLLLVEENIRYAGGNRVRFHHNVVRAMLGGHEGFALTAKNNSHVSSIDLEGLRKSLQTYLHDFDKNKRSFPSADFPLDFANLKVIALVQDDTTREILQGRMIEIEGDKKGGAGD